MSNKQFPKEISLIDFQDMPEFEEIGFRDLTSSVMATYLGSILTGYVPHDTLEALRNDPNWNAKAMRVRITVNDIQVLHEHFESMCSAFSHRMLTQRIRAGKWDDFENAVLHKAEQLASGAFTKFNDQVYDLQQQMQHLTENAEQMVKREWNSLYAHSVTEDMMKAGLDYSLDPAHAEIPRSKYVEGLYRAMVRAKPETVTSYLDAAASKYCAPKAVQAIKDLLGNCVVLDADIDQLAAEIYATAINAQTEK